MKPVPTTLLRTYKQQLHLAGIDSKYHTYYLKWFRYYYDFCLKYSLEGTELRTRASFAEKLRSKGQSADLISQADDAVGIYLQIVRSWSGGSTDSKPRSKETSKEKKIGNVPPVTIHKASGNPVQDADRSSPQQHSVRDIPDTPSNLPSETGVDWTKLYDDLRSAIQVRHYSPKTLRSYRSWVRKFQTFTKSKEPSHIEVEDVKAFLTWLAVERHVSASSQNLAFNSLLFFFRNALGKEFGKIDGVVRAKKRPYIPVVLDRVEVDQIVAELPHPYSLIVRLLYGCGLRLFECLQLRIQCFNFSAGVLTVHDGKGKKDRTVPRSGPYPSTTPL